MAPDKQAVPMKGARHAALSAKTTMKKQAPRIVLRSIAAQAAGRTPGKPGPKISVLGSKGGALLDRSRGLAGLAASTVSSCVRVQQAEATVREMLAEQQLVAPRSCVAKLPTPR